MCGGSHRACIPTSHHKIDKTKLQTRKNIALLDVVADEKMPPPTGPHAWGVVKIKAKALASRSVTFGSTWNLH